jgi:hypothetical protein
LQINFKKLQTKTKDFLIFQNTLSKQQASGFQNKTRFLINFTNLDKEVLLA